jgi:hypothetical protein
MFLKKIISLIANSKKTTGNENSNSENKSEETEKREKGNPRKKISDIKEYRREYMKKYLNNPEAKKRQREYCKNWMRNNRDEETQEKRKTITDFILAHGYPPPEEKVEEVEQMIYPDLFPIAEFNTGLEEILKYDPTGIGEKKLKDLVYDILDKKGILTPNRIMDIFHDPSWEKAIEESMAKRNYQKIEGKDGRRYVPKQE